jgi:uncharacterized DUF497 family protein
MGRGEEPAEPAKTRRDIIRNDGLRRRELPCLQGSFDDHIGEQRWIALGMAQPAANAAILLVVAHVYREDEHGGQIIPIISAREAEKRDTRRYQAQALDEG